MARRQKPCFIPGTQARLFSVPMYTGNEGPVSIQYKCLVPIYVFPEMKLLFPKQNYNVLSPSSYTYIPVWDLYISMISLPILLQGNTRTALGIYESLTDTQNVKIGTEAAQFPEKEYINGIFLAAYDSNEILLNCPLSIGHEGQPEQAGANCWRGGCLCPSQVVNICFILFLSRKLYLCLCIKGKICNC